MKKFAIAAVLVLAAGSLISPSSVSAQELIKEVELDKPEVNSLKTPEYGVSETKKTPSKREWLEVEVKFKVDGKTINGVVGNLEFSYYIVLNDEKKSMLAEKINHVNVMLDEDIYSSIYLSPSTIFSLFGKEVSASSAVAGIGIEVRHNGKLVGGYANPDGQWWQSRPQISGLLSKKSQTPFAPLWWDRYAEIERGSR